MTLAVDVGNSHTVIGLLDGRDVRHHWRVATDARRTRDEITTQLDHLLRRSAVSAEGIRTAVLSSVVPPMAGVWSEVIRDLICCEPLVVGAEIPLPIALAVDSPREVGSDRIANAVGGRERCGAPMLVVDIGTATTIDVVDGEGAYRGGVILPGPEISAEALFRRAAQLPRVAFRRPERAIGSNTLACMHSGLFHGFLGAVERLIDVVREELDAPECPVISTGGLGADIISETDRIQEHVPWLTLEGLVTIWEHVHSKA